MPPETHQRSGEQTTVPETQECRHHHSGSLQRKTGQEGIYQFMCIPIHNPCECAVFGGLLPFINSCVLLSNGFLCHSRGYLGFVIAEFWHHQQPAKLSCSTKLDSSVYTVKCNGFKSHLGKLVFML